MNSQDELQVQILSDQLRHRGPDGSGHIRTSEMILGMHRLSILDFAHGGQPFWCEDSTVGVLGNGEIYNASELREGLLARGHRFESYSDIEVVAHLYEESGVESLSLLRGMFALVVYDAQKRQVLLARDRLGEKPMAYSFGNGVLHFSSEIAPMVRAGIVPLELEPFAAAQYLLHGFVPEPMSIVRNVTKVPAAHVLRVSLDDLSLTLEQYWDPLDFVDDRDVSTQDLTNSVVEAIEVSCTSDTPIGIALSGGLDSSLVAAVASKVRPDLQAFTVGYGVEKFDETKEAGQLARDLGIDIHEIVIEAERVPSEFAMICGARDEPIADIAGPALAAVPQAARDLGVPVLMTGMGGDELFGGYEWIQRLGAWTSDFRKAADSSGAFAKLGISMPPKSRQGLMSWIQSGAGMRTERDLREFMRLQADGESTALPLYEFQYGYRRVFRDIEELTHVGKYDLSGEFRGNLHPSWTKAEYAAAVMASYLAVNGLAQVDRLCMRWSVESRTPLVDHRLVELVMSGMASPGSRLMPGKQQFRDVAASLLPEEVINRGKRGFTPPVRRWAREVWRLHRDARGEAIAAVTDWDPLVVARKMKRPTRPSGAVDQMAMRLMTLELWIRSLS